MHFTRKTHFLYCRKETQSCPRDFEPKHLQMGPSKSFQGYLSLIIFTMYNPPTPEEKKLHTHVGGHDNSIVDSSRSNFFDDRSYLTRTTFHFLAFSNTQFPELKCKHLSNAEKRHLNISQCEIILCLYIHIQGRMEYNNRKN